MICNMITGYYSVGMLRLFFNTFISQKFSNRVQFCCVFLTQKATKWISTHHLQWTTAILFWSFNIKAAFLRRQTKKICHHVAGLLQKKLCWLLFVFYHTSTTTIAKLRVKCWTCVLCFRLQFFPAALLRKRAACCQITNKTSCFTVWPTY